VDIAWNRTTKS